MNEYFRLLTALTFLSHVSTLFPGQPSVSGWPTKLQALRIANKAWDEGKAEVEADSAKEEELEEAKRVQYDILFDRSQNSTDERRREAVDSLQSIDEAKNNIFWKKVNARNRADEAFENFSTCMLSAAQDEISKSHTERRHTVGNCIESVMKKAAYVEYRYPEFKKDPLLLDKIFSQKGALKCGILYNLCVMDIIFLINHLKR